MKCIRCTEPGTVPVHEVETGSMTGDQAGPRGGVIVACDMHAAEIGREPGAWPWLAEQPSGAS
ncbi:hypothetical protein K378_01487 [Streptomyces sp. Amel2xB2]|nr:hypothetical protein K378_01487 [Streptomyces sp. Amel2xB2]